MENEYLDPPDAEPEAAECPNCKDIFIVWHPVYTVIPCYAFWDEEENNPLCSEDCLKEYEDEYGWEYES